MSIESLLTDGLQRGFGGSTNIEKIDRGGFQMTSSHYDGDDGIYHDEWVNGGGQELVTDTDGNSMTRTYVGNVISKEILDNLGITENDIMIALKTIIMEYGEKIRFDKDFKIQIDEWKYTYDVIYKRKDPFIINGIEEIYYKDISVFVHTFGISKIS